MYLFVCVVTGNIVYIMPRIYVYTHTHVVQNYTPFGREKKFCQVCNPSGAYHQNFRPAGSETKIRIQKQGFDMVDMGARKDAHHHARMVYKVRHGSYVCATVPPRFSKMLHLLLPIIQ